MLDLASMVQNYSKIFLLCFGNSTLLRKNEIWLATLLMICFTLILFGENDERNKQQVLCVAIKMLKSSQAKSQTNKQTKIKYISKRNRKYLSQSGFLFLHKHHDQNASWFIQLTFPRCCSSPKEVRTGTHTGQELTQGRDLEAGPDAEAMEGCCLLAYFPWLAQLAFLIEPRTISPGIASPTMGPPTLDH